MIPRLSAAACVLASSTFAAAAPWAAPSGSIPGAYSWSNGQGDNAFFGSPAFDAGGFTFSPSSMQARSGNGAPTQTASERIAVTITTLSGPIRSIDVSVGGSYTIANGGRAVADSFMSLSNPDAPISPPGNPVLTSGSFDLDLTSPPSSAAGSWSLPLNVPLPGSGATRLHVTLDLVLHATSPAGGLASIEQAGVVRVSIAIPEPASATTLAMTCSSLLLPRRRRRGCE